MAKAKTPPSAKRIAAFRSGLAAETQAASHLAALGFEIVAARYKSPFGEIDLIARHDRLIVFVEVKARTRIDDAAYAITPRQQKRIVAAAQMWLSEHPAAAAFDLRFDAMLIAPNRPPRHLIAAFDASE